MAPPEPGTAQMEDRDQLVLDNVALAHKIAFDYLARAPRHTDRDDIISAALLGLVEAARRFDPAHGTAFTSFASARVYGAVVDAARGQDPLTRRTRSAVRTLTTTEDTLIHTAGAVPSEATLAAAAGMDVPTVRKLRADLHTGVTKSLDEAFPGRADTYAATLVDADPTPLEALERRELDAYLMDAVALLSDRHREVILGHFLRGETNAEIGEKLGVTGQRVSQLRAEALRMLRTGVVAQFPDAYTDTTVAAPPAPGDSAAAARFRTPAATASYAAAVAARRTYAERLNGTL